MPHVEDLAELPATWVEQLSRDAVREEVFDGSAPNRTTAQRAKINEELYQQLISLPDNGSPPDRVVALRLDQALVDLTKGTGSRYETTRDYVAALDRHQAVGRVGAPSALAQFTEADVLEATDTRPTWWPAQVPALHRGCRRTGGRILGQNTEQTNGDKGPGEWAFHRRASFVLRRPTRFRRRGVLASGRCGLRASR